jgi:phosphoribosylformimino-5-aminoimidazole carboxamide ribotide isomerase
MKLFPAIDLYNQQVVRLKKGSFDDVTTYQLDPVEVAKSYQSQGATWLHVIDLNGAKTGTTMNLEVIKKIIENTTLKIQVGGGIRSIERIRQYLSIGVTRVIIGSYAIDNIDMLGQLNNAFPNQIVVSVDSKEGQVTMHGWQTTTSLTTLELCKKIEEAGIKTIVYTDIEKDGMMQGPNIEDYKMLQKQTNLNIIASGGVSSMKDILHLNDLNLYGAIVGKALYLNKLSVKEVLACLQEESYLA